MAPLMPNTYSQRWFRSFHIPIDDARTSREVDFIRSFAPLPRFRKIADVCCGMGRHARALSKRGYSVTGVDRDTAIITKARQLGGGPDYIQADLRDYRPEENAHDVVIILGQSFGHFDAATNTRVLHRLATSMRRGGRLILDVWNPDFFITHQGDRDFDRPDGKVHEIKLVENDRLFVHLTYPDGDKEDFEWQLFTPTEMEALVTPLGLTLMLSCTDFDRSEKLAVDKPRLQFVFERS